MAMRGGGKASTVPGSGWESGTLSTVSEDGNDGTGGRCDEDCDWEAGGAFSLLLFCCESDTVGQDDWSGMVGTVSKDEVDGVRGIGKL